MSKYDETEKISLEFSNKEGIGDLNQKLKNGHWRVEVGMLEVRILCSPPL